MSGPVWDSGDYGAQERAESEACQRCGFLSPEHCVCEPCDSCATIMDSGKLTLGADGRWRCPPCHHHADVKILCGERPAFRPSLVDLYLAVVDQMVRR